MGIRQKIARWALKAAAGDRLSAEQLVTLVFGPGTTGVRMGSAELLKAYETMPWLRAVVQKVSWATACVPWQLFVVTNEPQKTARKAGRPAKAVLRRDLSRSMDPDFRIRAYKALRQDDSLKEITNHPLLELLDNGNERFPGHTCRQITQQHLDLVGEGAWVVERNGLLKPSGILPIPPTWIAATPWDFQSGSNGMWLVHSNRGSISLPPEDLIYFYHPKPNDPYDRGTGMGHALGDELETDEYTARHLKRWFKNFAMPPAIISKKNPTSPVAGGASATAANVDRLEESWMKKLLGRNNVPFFSNQELSVNKIGDTFNDMQLSQLRKDERDIIIHTYGLPPEVFGILENSNRATIDAADYLLAKGTVVPRLEYMRAVIQRKLVEQFDTRLILDYVSPVVEDKDFQLKATGQHPYAFTVDEIRELAGKRKLPDDVGEGFMVPMSSIYVRDLTETGVDEVPEELEPEPQVPPAIPAPVPPAEEEEQ